jgi:hypothetical protein
MVFVFAGDEVCLTGRAFAIRGLTMDVGCGGFYVWW